MTSHVGNCVIPILPAVEVNADAVNAIYHQLVPVDASSSPVGIAFCMYDAIDNGWPSDVKPAKTSSYAGFYE